MFWFCTRQVLGETRIASNNLLLFPYTFFTVIDQTDINQTDIDQTDIDQTDIFWTDIEVTVIIGDRH